MTPEDHAGARSQRPVWLGLDKRRWDHVRIHVQLLKDERVKAIELAVYVGIAAHAELASGRAYPAAATLAKYVGLSERRVRESIQRLYRWHYLDITRHEGHASTYTLLPPPPLHEVPGCRAVTPERGDEDPGTTFRTSPEPCSDEREPVEREPKNETPLAPQGGEGDEAFASFWAAYPARNGRRVGKAKTQAKWRRLKLAGIADVLIATTAYAAAVATGETIAKDPERFLANDYWRDWLTPAEGGERVTPPENRGQRLPPARPPCDGCGSTGWIDSPDGGPRMVACPACNPDPLEAVGA